jgi:hypothetical protein
MSRACAHDRSLPRAPHPDLHRVLLLAALLPIALLGLTTREARALPAPAPLADPPRTYEAEPQEDDSGETVERYAFRVRPGASLWDIAMEALPRAVLDEGHAHAVEMIETSFKKTYPDRRPNDVRLNDAFNLEVPEGTFVTASLTSTDRGRTLEYSSFDGDTLTEYRADPALVYRLVRAAEPGRAHVKVHQGTSVPAVDIARRVYQTSTPDFLQVRTIRGALSESPVVEVDLQRPHLDAFRNYRESAVSVEPSEGGFQLYRFDPADEENPFLAVEDAIGDEWDAGNFPRFARREYYRDGSVKRYILTKPGDLLSNLSKPDNKHWASLAPGWSTWADGQPERLGPFTPAVNELGSLIPGRLLVLVHQPRRTGEGGQGLECLGIPLGLGATAGVAGEWWRRRRRKVVWPAPGP